MSEFPFFDRLRCWLSYRLGFGHWFYSFEECGVCGGSAADFDYHGERQGPKRYRCDECVGQERLTYSYSRCACGALYAYDPAEKPRPTAWDCSDILLGHAIPSGDPGAVTHGDKMPFVFWKVKEAPLAWALKHRRAEA